MLGRSFFELPARVVAINAALRCRTRVTCSSRSPLSQGLPWSKRNVARLEIFSSLPSFGKFPASSSSSYDTCSYDTYADETLLNLQDKLEDIIESEQSEVASESDVAFSNGVLTVNLGSVGTYVINKQSPNRQIWLSSPISGPKRYDLVNGSFVYLHDNVPLYDLLESELSTVFGRKLSLK